MRLHRKILLRTLFLLAAATAIFLGLRVFSQQEISMMRIPNPHGGSDSRANAINDQGQVVGAAGAKDGSSRAFLWSKQDGFADLGTLGGKNSEATAINSHGQIVGWASTGTGERHAFFWSPESGITDLGTFGGATSYANAINSHGQIVGTAETSEGNHHAFIWTRQTGMSEVGASGSAEERFTQLDNARKTLSFEKVSDDFVMIQYNLEAIRNLTSRRQYFGSAQAINDHGEVIFTATIDISQQHTFLWSPTSGLSGLIVHQGMLSRKGAFVGETAHLIGECHDPECGKHCALTWSREEGFSHLGTLGGLTGMATAINAHGHVVGWASTSAGEQHAFFWSQESGIIDLGTGNGISSRAESINNLGQITGTISVAPSWWILAWQWIGEKLSLSQSYLPSEEQIAFSSQAVVWTLPEKYLRPQP